MSTRSRLQRTSRSDTLTHDDYLDVSREMLRVNNDLAAANLQAERLKAISDVN